MTKVCGEHSKFGLARIWISWLTIRDGRSKSPFCSAGEMRPLCQPYGGESMPTRAVARADGVGFYSFFLAPPCSPSAAAHPTLVAAEKASRAE